MRKNRYRYKRYLLPLPKAIGDLLDTRVDYVLQLFGPAIVFLPKGFTTHKLAHQIGAEWYRKDQ